MSQIPEQLQDAIASRYSLERQVGRGGMATVYLGRDLKHDRPVAVKVLLPALGALLGAERFLREIKLVARLQHPHILPLYDSGEACGTLYYVMPYVPGDSLRDRLRRERRLPLRDALWIARDVADALYYAHGNDIVHRDIKPENILLSSAHAMVTDFGIARAVHVAGGEQWETLTESGVAVGTPAYMSPEQTVGDSDIDGRSDIYSLGCVLYEMLAGAPPFTGPDGEVLLAKRFTDAPPALSAVRDDVPAVVDDAVTTALAREPADRFANALDFTHAIWDDPSSRVAHVSGARHVRRGAPRRARRRGAWIAGSSLGVAAAIGGLWFTRYRSSPPETTVQTPPTATANHDTLRTPVLPRAAATMPSSTVATSAVPEHPAPERTTHATTRSTAAASPPTARHDAPAPTRDTRPDSVLASLRVAALQTRARAADAGAQAVELTPGDSLLRAADSSAAAGRRSESIMELSSATGVWSAVSRTARARSDSAARAARRPPADSPSAAAKAPVTVPAMSRPADSVSTKNGSDPRQEIRALIDSYARAIESRSVPAIGQLYPTITAAQRRDWEQFFNTVRDVQVRWTIAQLEVTGSEADAQIQGTYEYANTSTRRIEHHPVAFHASLQRMASGWRLRSIQ